MTKKDIAKVLLELTQTYNDFTGIMAIPNWENLQPQYKASIIVYVSKIIDNNYKNAEDFHDNWVKEKVEDGWISGDTHNAETKISTELKEFIELDINNQCLYSLLFNTTIALKQFLD
jgi:hypothetical protein